MSKPTAWELEIRAWRIANGHSPEMPEYEAFKKSRGILPEGSPLVEERRQMWAAFAAEQDAARESATKERAIRDAVEAARDREYLTTTQSHQGCSLAGAEPPWMETWGRFKPFHEMRITSVIGNEVTA